MSTPVEIELEIDIDAVPATGFALTNTLAAGYDSGPHAHARHQLLYASRGTLRLYVASAQWVLPPQRAAWIPARLSHRVRTRHAAELCTVYLDDALWPSRRAAHSDLRVFAATPLCREMVCHAARWGPTRDPEDLVASRFFAALALLCTEWAADPMPWHLPAARTPQLARAMEHLLARLDQPLDLAGAARAAGVSTRTLARRFTSEAETTPRQYLHAARMLRAMELLSESDCSVGQISNEVGYERQSAFSTAFRAFSGETPISFRKRVSARERDDSR